jgi:adenylate kinase
MGEALEAEMRCTLAQLYVEVKTARKVVRLRCREGSRRTIDAESAENFNRHLARCREAASDITIFPWPEPVTVANVPLHDGRVDVTYAEMQMYYDQLPGILSVAMAGPLLAMA